MTDLPENPTYDDKVAQTRRRFVHSLNGRLDAILEAMRSTPQPDSGETQTRHIHRLLHDMAGNSAMLELEGIESSIRKGLAIAERVDAARQPLSDTEIKEIETIVEQTRSIATQLEEQY
ncbi:hypothetical protein GGR95_002405 [Sulfitobacter undariae]|uniref:Hpt domain-containing protein n=1 Tax=Sulfitobacter undariae TaxID=1563671 RepID=A0A7W6H0B6_9RHOB|nr:hypothetical protein [Sulfitobacter undariae]MBB3994756.1 hypothetical protein [Sulfitobacter undariae]